MCVKHAECGVRDDDSGEVDDDDDDDGSAGDRDDEYGDHDEVAHAAKGSLTADSS